MGTGAGEAGGSDSDMAILDGTATDVPPLSSNIVRVFLSSTFSDMAEERNILLKQVYPRLKEYTLRKYGAMFQMVDMRWGVTSEAQNDHMTSTVCLKEIRNCQQLSVGPNFVALLGQKYGYRPIPATIDAEEFELLRRMLVERDEDVNILDLWYLRDDNAEPSQYVLQPINSILKNYDSTDDDLKREAREEWTDSFNEMRESLKMAATLAFDEGLIGGQTKEKYYMSVTEEEIQAGLLQNGADINKKCLCFIRHIEDLHANIGHHRATKFIDLVSKGETTAIDSEAQDMVTYLREQKIPEKLNKENIVRLSTKWSGKDGINSTDNAEYLDKLSETFYERMVWIIDENLKDVEELRNDEQTVEVIQSLQIRNEWTKIFSGRDNILRKVQQYLLDDSNRQPFVLYGESGCGKTALIAKCAKQTPVWFGKITPATVVRFLGTSPQTSNILLTLQSVCTQIAKIYNLADSKVPSEYQEVVDFFSNVMELPTGNKPLMIFIDSLDQLSPAFDPHNLRWLPRTLPKHVKVVISLIPYHRNILQRFQSQFPKLGEAEIPPLGNLLSIEVLHARLKNIERTITKHQHTFMENLFAKHSLPLFTRIMFEEVSLWKSYSSITESMVSASTRDALNNLFERLELQHGRVLVHHALAYITASRDGLSEIELLDLLSLDDDVLSSIFLFWLPPVRRLPPFLWTRLRLDLDKFLVVREAGDQDVLVWYHRQFAEAARERYLRAEETRQVIQGNLAEYFIGTWGGGRKKPFRYGPFLKSRLALTNDVGEEDRNTPLQPLTFQRGKGGAIYNKRKLSELPFHLVNCGKLDLVAETCVFNYQWLLTKLKAFGLQPLLMDLTYINSICKDEEIQTLTDALRIAGSTLNNSPENLALEISGRLLDFFETSAKLRRLINQCDVEGVKQSVLLAPFQLFELPISALSKTLEGSSSEICDGRFLKQGSVMAAIYKDGSLKLWDVAKGEVVKQVPLPNKVSNYYLGTRLYQSRDQNYLVCKCKSSDALSTVVTVQMSTSEVLYCHKNTDRNPKHATVVGDKYLINDNAVHELSTGRKIKALNDYRKVSEFVTIAITRDEDHILIGTQTAVEMFTIAKAKKVVELPVTNIASNIEVTSDNRLAIVGQAIDCNIKIFDISVQSQTFGQEVVTYNPNKAFPDVMFQEDNYASSEVSEISLSNKGRAFVSLVKRKYPIVWSLKNVSTKPRLLNLPPGSGQFRYLHCVQFSSDDRYVLAAEISPNIMMWDAVSGELLTVFTADTNDVHRLIPQEQNVVATIAQSSTSVKFWDLAQFLKKGELSTRKERTVPAHSVTFSNQSETVFISRAQPLKNSKAFHFIDHFGIDVLRLKSGKMDTLLPFDKYGPFQNVAVSKDASIMVITTGTATQSVVNIVDLHKGTLISSITVLRFKAVKVSWRGRYLAIFTHDSESQVRLYSLPGMVELGSYDGCLSGMFSDKCMFIGVTAERKLIVRETMEEDETLTITLQGDVKTLHYCDLSEVLLVTVDNGLQLSTTAFKTDGFASIGTMMDVSKGGISDVANDGSVCIDMDLQVFELQRCKRVKWLLKGTEKGGVSSIRLSRNGEHAVFIDTKPSDCIKVCRIVDSSIVAVCSLHSVPEVIEIVPKSNIVVAIGKNKSLFILALRDSSRESLSTVDSRPLRLEHILDTKEVNDTATQALRIPESVQKQIKEKTKELQTKNFSLNLRREDSIDPQSKPNSTRPDVKKSGKSSLCSIG